MYRLIVILFCLLCSAVSHGQMRSHVVDSILSLNKPDSTKSDYISNYAFDLSERNTDSALSMCRIAIELAVSSKNEKTYANAMNNVAWVYYRAMQFDTAKMYFFNAERIYIKLGSNKDLARLYSNLANVYDTDQDYETALDYLIRASKICDPKDTLGRALIGKHIGVIYRRKGYREKAKEYLQRAVADFYSQKSPKLYADATQSLGIVYFELGNYDSARYCYRTALAIYIHLENYLGVSIANEGIGVVFQALAEKHGARYLDSALFYYKSAYDYSVLGSNPAEIAYMKVRLGDVCLAKKDFRSAETNFKEALVTFKQLKSYANVYHILRSLGQLNADLKDYKQAYNYEVLSSKYKDTMNVQARDAEMADMLGKYEAEKKDKTIALLNTQNSLLNTKKKLAENDLYKRRTTELFALVVILFAVGFAFVLINRYRIKQRLYEMQMRNRISNDLHDDVGSSLSSILLLSNIAKGDGANKPELLYKISENAAEVIERISDIVWVTNPSYDDGENMRSKIMNHVAPLCQMQGIALHANVSEAIRVIRFSMDSRKNLFLIIKEAINNILKHAQATEITINAFLKERTLFVEIMDNGRGFDRGTTNIGNGLVTLQSRAVAMKGTMDMESAPGKGTKITITIPISRSNYFTIKKLDGVYES